MTTESVAIKFTVSGDDLVKLKAFAEREGFTSLHLAARVLAIGAISDYPKWGALRAARETEIQKLRQRAWSEFATLVLRLKAEFDASDDADRNVEATIEKGQVTFSREYENQE